jgi:hypothetical protein
MIGSWNQARLQPPSVFSVCSVVNIFLTTEITEDTE